MSQKDHYVIIGNGPAGNSAVDILRQNNKTAKITIISGEPVSFYYKHRLTHLIEGKITDDQLSARPYDYYKEKNIRIRLGQKVEKIDPENRILYLKHMEKVHYTKLLIASGGIPRVKPALLDFSSHFIHLNSYKDSLLIEPLVRKNKQFTLIGGDIKAFCFLRMLSNLKKKADILLDAEAFWPFRLTDEMTSAIIDKFTNEYISITSGDEIVQVEKTNSGYITKTESGKSYESDLIFSFMGMNPNIQFAVGSGINTDRGFLVDEKLMTNFDDIFACGDCAQIYNSSLKDYWVSTGWHNAEIQGKFAAENLLGESQTVSYPEETTFDFEGLKINTYWWKALI